MRETLSLGRTIGRVIEWGDYWRRTRPHFTDERGHKEWFHFCLSQPDLDVIVNFSVSDDLRGGSAEGEEAFRVLCAVRTEAGWDGDVDELTRSEVWIRPGSIHARMGDSSLDYADGAYDVHVQLERRPIELALRFRPTAIPSQVNDIALSSGRPAHWFLVPRLIANGEIRVGDRTIEVEGASAYHDHNWGHFRWGRGFSWTWGYAHSSPGGVPWTIAFDRLTSGSRNEDLARGILLWKGARQHRLFRGHDVTVREEGFLRRDPVFKLPRVLGLLCDGTAADVPERLTVRAQNRGDVLELEFRARDLFQIVTPHDDDAGCTIINEVSGDLSLEGTVAGERVALQGRAMFEFLR